MTVNHVGIELSLHMSLFKIGGFFKIGRNIACSYKSLISARVGHCVHVTLWAELIDYGVSSITCELCPAVLMTTFDNIRTFLFEHGNCLQHT